jgi:GNAT superfamily N-acetyltransferase
LSEITIRPVTEADVESLEHNCFPRSGIDRVRAMVVANTKDKRVVHLVAQSDGDIVGTIELVSGRGRRDKHRGELRRFVVAEGHRGKGVARALLDAARKEAAKLGIETLDASARAGTPAEEIFRKLGFVEFGRLEGGLVMPFDEEEVYDLIYFYLPVDPEEAGTT